MKKPTHKMLPTPPLQSPATPQGSKSSRPPSRFASIAGWPMWCLAAVLIGASVPVYAEEVSDDTTSAKTETAEAQHKASTAEASSAASSDSASSRVEQTGLKSKPLAGASIEAKVTNTGAGLWIFIDPETGQQVAQPTQEQKVRLRKFATALNKSDQGLEPFELEGGGRGVRLNGRFQHAVIATVQADGTIGFHCTDQTHDHSEHALHDGEHPPATAEPAVEQ